MQSERKEEGETEREREQSNLLRIFNVNFFVAGKNWIC